MNTQIKSREDLLIQARAEITPVDAERAKIMMKKAALVLDVREPAEYQSGHLPHAINVPRGVLEFKVGNHPELNEFERSILIYCKNGGRSTLAAYTLIQMGFTQVEMLNGGFDGWADKGHKIELDPSIN
jgi:rhodanese-related sulfurtransferase